MHNCTPVNLIIMKKEDRLIKEFETILLWENGCNREQLSKITGIGIRTIQKFLNNYISHSNGAIYFNYKYNTYMATDNFNPTLIEKDPTGYTELCLAEKLNQSLIPILKQNYSRKLPIEDTRQLSMATSDDHVMNTLIEAINTKSQISSTYVSKKGTRNSIIISPHAMALARNRYHIRAYHHKYNRYSDFAVGRFELVKICSEQGEGAGPELDVEWHTYKSLNFELNPELSSTEIESYQMEWCLPPSVKQRRIVSRQALQKYVIADMERPSIGSNMKTWLFKGYYNED